MAHLTDQEIIDGIVVCCQAVTAYREVLADDSLTPEQRAILVERMGPAIAMLQAAIEGVGPELAELLWGDALPPKTGQ